MRYGLHLRLSRLPENTLCRRLRTLRVAHSAVHVRCSSVVTVHSFITFPDYVLRIRTFSPFILLPRIQCQFMVIDLSERSSVIVPRIYSPIQSG